MHLPLFQTDQLPAADGAVKPFVTMGSGVTSMVVVPGAADGLRTCVDVAVYLAWFYRHRAEECRLLILSRREPIPSGFGVERHAEDMADTLDQLGWGPAVWECISAAGPIGQQVATRRPDLVQGLILSSTYDYVSARTKRVLTQWLNLARQPAGAEAFSGILEEKYRPPAEVLAGVAPGRLPAAAARGPERIVRILEELLELDHRAIVPRITCPTLVIGGENDRTVPAEVQRAMAARIPHCELSISPGFGHFNDMDNPAYQQRVLDFAKQAVRTSPRNAGG